MESFLSNLKEEVQCPLCNQTLSEPKLLQCFHTFCKSCIQRHAQLTDQDYIFKCPKCSSETLLTDLSDYLEDLESSPLHSQMLQVLAFSAENEKSCSVSESHSTALWQCLDCNHSLCDKCLKSHAMFTLNHQVISLSDLRKDDLESILKRGGRCKSHLNHTVEFFCKDCAALICAICWNDDHKNHKTLTLQEVSAFQKELLTKNLEECERMSGNKVETKLQQEISERLKSDGEKVKKEVKKFTKKLVKSILDQEQQILNQIENRLSMSEKNLRIIRHIPAAKEYMEKILENEILCDIAVSSEIFTFSPNKADTAGIVFYSNEDWSQQVLSGKLGDIKLTSKSSSSSSEFYVDSDLHANTKAKLSILTKYSTGEINYDESDVLDIKFSPVDDAKIEEKTIKTGGKIEVEFTPQVSGQLTIEVKLNGIPVSNSPLVTSVKPQLLVQTDENLQLRNALSTGSGKLLCIAANKTNSRIAASDGSSHCVRIFSINGELLLKHGSKGSTQGQYLYPQGLAFLNDTDLVIADRDNHRICILNTTTGTLLRTFGRHGNGNGEFSSPAYVEVDDTQGDIIVTDNGNCRVQVFTKNGDYQYQFTVPNQNNFRPISTVSHNGLFYISDWKNGVVHVVGVKDGTPTRLSTIRDKGLDAGERHNLYGLAIDSDFNLLVCNHTKQVISKFTLDGRFIGESSKFSGKPLYIGVLRDGQFICTHSSGNVLFFKN